MQVAQTGYYNLVLRYATGFTVDQKLAVEVNGSFSQQAVFAPTGTWDGWRPHTLVVALRAGVNTIMYRASSPETGYINMDHLKVAPAQTIYEAETAATNGDLFYNYSGATGTQGGIVANLYAGRYVSFTVQVAQAGYHNLILRYSTGYTTNQQLALEVNGEFDQRVVFAPTGAWDGWRPHTVEVALRAGVNTITYRTVSPETGYISIDHLKVESVADVASAADQLGDNYYTQVIDSLTQYLDRSQIPSGILYDRVLPLAALHTFNEGALDTSSYHHFRQAYLELRTAAYNRASFRFTSPELREQTRHFASQDSVVIGVMDYRFNLIDTLAAQQNLLRDQQGMTYDVAGRPRSPYLARTLTLVAALTDTLPTQQTRFTLAPAFNFKNRFRILTRLAIDFGDGNGPQWYAPGHTVAVNYPTPGAKVLRYTFQFNDGTSATGLSSLFVKRTLPYAAGKITPLPIAQFSAAIPFEDYTAPYRSIRGVGDGMLYMSNAAQNPDQLSRPVILVDGFDPGSGTRPVDVYGELPIQLRDYFDTAERDLIILNFPKYVATARLRSGAMQQVNVDGGADYIERNAFVLVKLIQDMKGRLAPGEKFTIIGPSMGGLITRYALAYMEEKYRTTGLPEWDHRSALWISMDSPHQGANIPIGDQEFLNYYKGLSDAAEENLNIKIGSVAAKQMLVHHY